MGSTSFLDARMDAFLTGHALAFEAFGAVPRVVLYDNCESAWKIDPLTGDIGVKK